MRISTLMIALQSLSPKEMYRSTKAKKSYRETHGECAMCGSEKYLEVHHVVPVHVDPMRAADHRNLITLCDGPNGSNSACHRYFGHFGSFRYKHNPLIREQSVINRFLMHSQDPEREFLYPAELMIMEFSECQGISSEEFIENLRAVMADLV